LTIHIPEDLARQLEGMAAAQKKSAEQIAIERLRSLVDSPGSPGAVLRAMKQPPMVSPSAVDELEAAIASGRLRTREHGPFDE
jgi:predicted transcriptional regulator